MLQFNHSFIGCFPHDKLPKITLTLEFCAQPLRHVWLMYEQIAELEKYVEYRAIKNLSGFNGFTSDYRS